jgi:hypothetical protein
MDSPACREAAFRCELPAAFPAWPAAAGILISAVLIAAAALLISFPAAAEDCRAPDVKEATAGTGWTFELEGPNPEIASFSEPYPRYPLRYMRLRDSPGCIHTPLKMHSKLETLACCLCRSPAQ